MPDCVGEVLQVMWRRLCENGLALEKVVPIVCGRAEASDSGVERGRLLGDGIAGGIGVETTIDGTASGQQCGKPLGIGPSTGCGYAQRRGMQQKATHRVDGGFAEHDHCGSLDANGEVAEIFLRTSCHATPTCRCCAAQFSAGPAEAMSKNAPSVVVRKHLERQSGGGASPRRL